MKKFQLADVFCDGMIFQRNQPIYIYGEAFEDCEIAAKLDGKKTTANVQKGFFRMELDPHTAASDLTLEVCSGAQCEVIRNVFCGEVWLAGGQSNMACFLKYTEAYKNGEPILHNENIRFYTVGRNAVAAADAFGEGYEWAYNADIRWDSCNERTAPFFSAVAYYFAQDIQNKLGVPVGIINCNVGGSNIYNWIPESVILQNRDIQGIWTRFQEEAKNFDLLTCKTTLHKYLDQVKKEWCNEDYLSSMGGEIPTVYYEEYGPYCYRRPCCLYHSMLSKVAHFNVRGMIWYQGESDACTEAAGTYKSAMYSLVGHLKNTLNNPAYSFQFVQLAPWDDPHVKQWQDVCNAQREFFMENPLWGMITIGDCGDADIHPVRKKPVGQRLALAALNNAYGIPCEFVGPCAVEAKFRDGEIEIAFTHDKGMYVKDTIGRFEVEDYAGNFIECRAYLKSNKVYVEYPAEQAPKSVRYAWCAFPHIGLYNDSHLPASIFAIDICS